MREMTRKSVWWLALFIWLGQSALAAGPGNGPLGLWELVGQKNRLRIEFSPDGNYRAMTRQRILFGKWSLVDQAHIATWSNAQRPKRINRFRVDKDRLYITDRNGVVYEHRRVHAVSAKRAAHQR